MIRLVQDENFLVVDFQRESADTWTLLVIDDLVHLVRKFVQEPANPLDPEDAGEAPDTEVFAKMEAAEDRWAQFKTGIPGLNPYNVKALVMLPATCASIPEVGALAFMEFFPNGSFADALKFVERHSISTSKLAVLIDIEDVVTQDQDEGLSGLERTWPHVAATGRVSPHAVAIFSHADYVSEFGDLPRGVGRINKAFAIGPDGAKNFNLNLLAWIRTLEGRLERSNDEFARLTRSKENERYWPAHDAHTLHELDKKDLEHLLTELGRSDPYSVWRWCELGLDGEGTALARQWLAAKSFVKTAATSSEPLVTALIALIEGVKLQRRPSYKTRSGLARVDENELHNLFVLGSFRLSSGTFEEFAAALRDWLVHPEQFAPRQGGANRQIEHVEIKIGGGASRRKVRLIMTFDGKLPAALTGAAAVPSQILPGRSASALECVAVFAEKSAWTVRNEKSVLTLEFCYVAPTSLALAPQ